MVVLWYGGMTVHLYNSTVVYGTITVNGMVWLYVGMAG